MRIPSTASIVVLTGAGISAESGLSTFRGGGGLWENHRVEDVASLEGFVRNPEAVHRFYNQRRAQVKTVEPNAAHLALAELEKVWPGDFLVVTQNVDDLHERAGSQKLIHMHGELAKVRCMICAEIFPWADDTAPDTSCPACGHTESLRPHIVWFGEMPFDLYRIGEALDKCGLFVSIGTSGIVYPAAGFVEMVNPFAYTLELNLEPSQVVTSFFETRNGKATELVPALVEELLAGQG